MAIIKVITPSVTDENITTAKVTDNAITLAKMASGTDGNIISYDASGNPVAIATGSDGQVLTSTGAGSPPAFETASGGSNTPYFYGELGSNQSMQRDTLVKITSMTTDEIDSNSAFDGTTFTVPSGQAGKYFIQGSVTGDFGSIGRDGQETVSAIYKNGSLVKLATIRGDSSANQNQSVITTIANKILNLSVGDTIELYGQTTDANGGTAVAKAAQYTYFLGYKLIT